MEGMQTGQGGEGGRRLPAPQHPPTPRQGLVPGRAAAPSQVGVLGKWCPCSREQTPLGRHTSLSLSAGTCTCDSTSLTLTVKGASPP